MNSILNKLQIACALVFAAGTLAAQEIQFPLIDIQTGQDLAQNLDCPKRLKITTQTDPRKVFELYLQLDRANHILEEKQELPFFVSRLGNLDKSSTNIFCYVGESDQVIKLMHKFSDLLFTDHFMIESFKETNEGLFIRYYLNTHHDAIGSYLFKRCQ